MWKLRFVCLPVLRLHSHHFGDAECSPMQILSEVNKVLLNMETDSFRFAAYKACFAPKDLCADFSAYRYFRFRTLRRHFDRLGKVDKTKRIGFIC